MAECLSTDMWREMPIFAFSANDIFKRNECKITVHFLTVPIHSFSFSHDGDKIYLKINQMGALEFLTVRAHGPYSKL